MTAVRATPEERAAAMAVYREHGLAEAHRQSDVPKSTLRFWAQQDGLDPRKLAGDAVAQTAAANEAREARIAEMRLELREELLSVAIDMAERTKAPHVDYRGRDMTRVVFDHAPADACRNYLVAGAIAIDKFRLESGETTGHVQVDRGPVEQQKQRVEKLRDELTARRESKAS
jgi:hypothetical protein